MPSSTRPAPPVQRRSSSPRCCPPPRTSSPSPPPGGTMRKALPLMKGDVIAVCAPAGPVDASRLDRGIARLAAAGFVPEIADGVLASEGYVAGGDAHRASQVEWALTPPQAPAVMAAGGRKRVVGFSALGAVLSYLSTRLGFPCLHGPMAAADLAGRFDPAALDAFSRLAAGEGSPREPG